MFCNLQTTTCKPSVHKVETAGINLQNIYKFKEDSKIIICQKSRGAFEMANILQGPLSPF